MTASSRPTISPKLRAALQSRSADDKKLGINALFKAQPDRVDRFSFDIEGIYLDFSKTHISEELQTLYSEFAHSIDFEQRREALFKGAKINTSEDRAVLHMLLRDADNQGVKIDQSQFLEQAATSRQQFVKQLQTIRQKLQQRDSAISNIIHIGIGGSSLGTQLAFEALRDAKEAVNIHFVGNIDAHQLVEVLHQCDASNTMVIGVSKTFTTAETLQNIRSVGAWFESQGVKNYLDSVYAVTADPQAAAKFGIAETNTVTFPQWVGGRYSVWSSVSLSAALVLGSDKFAAFLAGAAAVDRHFFQSSPLQNICFTAAMMDHYYRNFFSSGSRAIFAYDYRLRSLVDYLQQLETESNGKDKQLDGRVVDQHTAPVVWGGVGTDVQHSVFQMLHQGTDLIPAEFVLIANADHDLPEHHTELLANGIAQTAALLAGQDLQTVYHLQAGDGLSELTAKAKVFSGERPSTTLLLERLTPRVLGALLAFYEHRTFCNGLFANINSFDQMGVELGKRLAKQVKPLLVSAKMDKNNTKQKLAPFESEFDASTTSLINKLLTRQ